MFIEKPNINPSSMFAEKPSLNPAFLHNEYVFRKKVLKLFGGSFKVFDGNENLVLYSKQKAFKLKEDFRVYSDENKTTELLALKTNQIIDMDAKYNVQDSITDELVGSIGRQMMKSMLKDEWIFFSKDNQKIGKFTESSTTGAIIRRVVDFIPFINIFSGLFLRSYIIVDSDNIKIAEIKQKLTLFVLKYKMNIIEQNPSIDRRLLISMGILLAGIEGTQ